MNLEKNDIITKTINTFLLVEEGTEVCFSELLSQALNINALATFETNILFELYDLFLKECKKRKIKIVFHEYGGPVGLPFNLGLWRVTKPMIKKIVYNLFYGCWGMRGELSRTYVIFEKHKITYCREPLDDYSHKDNCMIKVSYNPSFSPDLELYENNRDYDFAEICSIVDTIEKNHKENTRVLDAIPASVVVSDDEKGKKIIKSLDFSETEQLDLFVEKYMPESFKQATRHLD